MERYELQKLRDLPIEGVAQRLGLRVVRHKALCPFHEDHHPSLSFCLRKNTFRCFVCDAHGGTIDLVMQYLRLDFLEACRWLQGRAPLPPGGGAQASAQTSAQEQLPSSPSSSSIGNPPPGGRGAVGRGALASSPRFRFPYGSRCGIYNLPVLNMLRPGEELWITEGCSDCWAMLSSGRKAIAIPSATLLSQKDKDILSTLSSQLSLSFHMYPDRDAPGERLFLQLKQVLPTLQHHQLPQGCKDYAEYYSLTPGPSPRGEGS